MAYYLADVKADIEIAKEKFVSTEGETESVVARYLESALEEISMTLSGENKTTEP
jgi:hypothetical protein